MIGKDWTSCDRHSAPPQLLCMFRRAEWRQPGIGYACEFSPEFNVAGLEWKLTGIAKEALAGMSPEAQARALVRVGSGNSALGSAEHSAVEIEPLLGSAVFFKSVWVDNRIAGR